MQVEQAYLLDLMGAPGVRFRIPLYQRVYAWTERQCAELLADVQRAGDAGCDHFLGTVLVGASDEADGAAAVLDLIDGQQRFTTVLLLLTAIRDRARELGLAADAVDPAALDERFLLSGGAVKLQLSLADQPTLRALVVGTELPGEDELSRNLVDNLAFFKGHLESADEVRRTWRGLQRLVVIRARLEPDDQPQAVFESLNSKGMALSPADLIRNLLFVRFGYEEQKRLFQTYWEPIEGMFEEDEDMPDLYITAALHAWLEEHAPALKVQDRSEIYSAFKSYVRDNPELPLEDLLRSLHDSCAAFAQQLDTREAKRHIDWVQGKLTGLISERHLFGD